MKKITFLLSAIIIVLAFFGGYAVKSLLTKNESPEITKVEATVKTLSAKEIWLKELDQRSRELVAVIDSFRPAYFSLIQDYRDRGINYEENFSNREWRETEPCSLTWDDTDYNEESGEKITTRKLHYHLGHCYLLEVVKEEPWRNFVSQEKRWESFILSYGILLDPDTIKGKIFPKGTYVAHGFIREGLEKYAEVKYFSEYEKFSAFIYKEMESAKELFEWPSDAVQSAGNIAIHL